MTAVFRHLGFLRLDGRNVRRDSLLSLVLISPLLLALALRTGYPAFERWAGAVHGLELAPHRGVLLALLVVLHVPFVFGMLGALLTLDDADDRALLALRVTPVSLGAYLTHRVIAVTLGAALGLVVAVPLAGLADGPPSTVWPAVALGATTAPLVTLAVLATASNKVEGMAVVKLLGLVVYLPLIIWVMDGPVAWALAAVPTFWPVRALQAGLDGRIDVLSLTAGTCHAAAAFAVLRRRSLRRWQGGGPV